MCRVKLKEHLRIWNPEKKGLLKGINIKINTKIFPLFYLWTKYKMSLISPLFMTLSGCNLIKTGFDWIQSFTKCTTFFFFLLFLYPSVNIPYTNNIYMSKNLNSKSNNIRVIRCLKHYPTPLPCYPISSTFPS